jgi:hypothetical protein
MSSGASARRGSFFGGEDSFLNAPLWSFQQYSQIWLRGDGEGGCSDSEFLDMALNVRWCSLMSLPSPPRIMSPLAPGRLCFETAQCVGESLVRSSVPRVLLVATPGCNHKSMSMSLLSEIPLRSGTGDGGPLAEAQWNTGEAPDSSKP